MIVEWLFRYGSIEDHQCREHCGYCTTLRSRVPELRIDLEPMGYTISDPDKDERNWRKNKTNSGKHRVYRLLRVEKQLDIFNDPWGREALRRNGGVA